jgi:hypothetical protein
VIQNCRKRATNPKSELTRSGSSIVRSIKRPGIAKIASAIAERRRFKLNKRQLSVRNSSA